MMREIRELALNPGTVLCLHLPFGAEDPADELPHQLRQFADRSAKQICFARGCEFDRRARGNRDQTCVDWLAQAARISVDEAAAIIRGFRIPVALLLSQIAANPRRFLGVAAALARQPDVLVYETAGMDPRGRYGLHEYVAERGLECCIIHLSHPGVFGTGQPAPRICPATARCLELNRIS